MKENRTAFTVGAVKKTGRGNSIEVLRKKQGTQTESNRADGIADRRQRTTAFTTEELVQTLRTTELHKVSGFGYLSSNTGTDLTDRLHETFGFGTASEFISEKTMKKLLKGLKER